MVPELAGDLALRASDLGADLFGIADLRPVRDFVVEQGGERVRGFSHALVFGMRLSNTVVDRIDPLLAADFSVYGWHVYKAISPAVDQIALHLARDLTDRGFAALPIPSSQYRNQGERVGLFSHKLAAHLAGLGWIGKNCLLITPEFGPRVRLASVLTDCELDSGTRMDGRCGDCRVCVDVCPAGAIRGRAFDAAEEVGARLDVRACGSYRDGDIVGAKRGAHVCGLCLAVCPMAYPEREGWRHPFTDERRRTDDEG